MKADAKTAGGIFLPDSAQKELNQAQVLAVGPGAMDKEGKRIPMSVAAGDKVLIPQVRFRREACVDLDTDQEQFGGSPVKVGEDEFSLFRDHEYVHRTSYPQLSMLTSMQYPCEDQRVDSHDCNLYN